MLRVIIIKTTITIIIIRDMIISCFPTIFITEFETKQISLISNLINIPPLLKWLIKNKL